MLSVRALDAFYGRAQVLFRVSLEVANGEVVALMGRNGAGKSTLLKSIMGLVAHRAEEISFGGADIRRLDAFRINRLGVGYVPEERRIFTDLTVAENLEVGRQPPREGVPSWSVEHLFELFPNLAEVRERRAAHISGGEQQMLTIARTLVGNPAILLLDEPSEGLAPKILEQIARTVAELKGHGLTILLAEQNLRFAGAVADRVVVIETGRIRWAGTMDALTTDADAQARYLLA